MNSQLRSTLPHYLAIAAAMYLCWGNTYMFFWRDEWNFLSDLRSVDAGWFFTPFNGHIKPIFKTLYFTELHLFGINNMFYLLVNLLIYTVAACTFRKLIIEVTTDTGTTNAGTIATVLAMLFAAHPINFNHLLWSFQVSQSLFLMFQVLSVLYFVRYITTGLDKHLWMTILFVLCQNYSFGNGLFFSLVFAFCVVVFGKENKFRNASIFVIIFIVTIAIQAIAGNPDGLAERTLREPFVAIVGIFRLMDISICRMFTIADVIYDRLPFVSLSAFVAFLIFGFTRRDVNRQYLAIFALWFAVNCLSIPIARPGSTIFPHYYSVMTLMPLALCVWVVFGSKLNLLIANRTRQTLTGAAVLFVVFYLVDARMSSIFSRRNSLNELDMKDSIKNNETYYPYDDPYYVIGGEYRIGDVKDAYIYWRDRTTVKVIPPEPK